MADRLTMEELKERQREDLAGTKFVAYWIVLPLMVLGAIALLGAIGLALDWVF